MKNLSYVLSCVVLFMSCNNDCENLVDEFQNNSGKKVEIFVYQNYEPNIPSGTFSIKHTLQDQQSISQTDKNCAPYNGRLDFVKLMQGDSIVIDFGDRKLRYGIINVSSPRNPFLLARQSLGGKTFKYILTTEDYSNAQ